MTVSKVQYNNVIDDGNLFSCNFQVERNAKQYFFKNIDKHEEKHNPAHNTVCLSWLNLKTKAACLEFC